MYKRFVRDMVIDSALKDFYDGEFLLFRMM